MEDNSSFSTSESPAPHSPQPAPYSSLTRPQNKRLLATICLVLVILLGLSCLVLLSQKHKLRSLTKELAKTEDKLKDSRGEIEELEDEVAQLKDRVQQSGGAGTSQEEVKQLVEKVGKLYDLPDNETPSIATVVDKEKLRDQPFFKNAQNGDITLIYSSTKLAILYRPSTDAIINVSEITL